MTLTTAPTSPPDGDDLTQAREVAATLKPLFQRLSEDSWTIGDVLLQADLGDRAIGRVAQECRVKVATLRRYQSVSAAFEPGARDPNIAWSVYKELTRVPDAAERMSILRTRTDWTVDLMKVAVRAHLRQSVDAPSSVFGVQRERSGMRVGHLHFVAESMGDSDKVKLTITSTSSDVQTIKTLELPGEIVMVLSSPDA